MTQEILFHRTMAAVPGAVVATLALLCGSEAPAIDTDGIAEYRSADGSGNHAVKVNRGRTGEPLYRKLPPAYGDGTDLPRGVPTEDDGDGDVETDEQTLPSGRDISNAVHDQGTAYLPSGRLLNQFFFQFGQFLSHDTGLSEPNGTVATGGASGLSGNESFPIDVDGADPDFAFPEISLTRSIAEDAGSSSTGRREQINQITAFIDASNVYGSDQVRADALRAFTGGLLLEQPGPDGPLLPYNTAGIGVENANPLHLPDATMFAAGDVRANEQVGLICFHTLFLREHNRLARRIAARDFAAADLSSPGIDEEIYQRARAAVGALLQKITYYEWLPTLLGKEAIPPYRGYKANVDPQVANEFSTAAFRIGHTMLPSIYLLEDDGGNVTPLALQNAFFNPSYVAGVGIDSMLRGQAGNLQSEIDAYIVDDVRNFLFGPGFGGLDLGALNIQRGRDHGVPSFHVLRQAYGLSGIAGFSDIGPSPAVAAALQTAYGAGNHEDVDAWTGGLSERHLRGTSMGPTFTAIFVDQFTRLRDGDRFYFENTDIYPDAFIREIRSTTFADVILRNTGLEAGDVNHYAFFLPGYHPFQPDLRIGTKRTPRKHKADNRYRNSGRGSVLRMSARAGQSSLLYFSLENDAAFQTGSKLKAKLTSRHAFAARVFSIGDKGRKNVTASIFSERLVKGMYPRALRVFQATIRLERRSRSNALKSWFTVRSRCVEDPSARDTVSALIKLRN